MVTLDSKKKKKCNSQSTNPHSIRRTLPNTQSRNPSARLQSERDKILPPDKVGNSQLVAKLKEINRRESKISNRPTEDFQIRYVTQMRNLLEITLKI